MSGQPGAAERFRTELRLLYEAAGRPDLATVTRQAAAQNPPLMLSDATVNDWLNGKTIPSIGKTCEFRFLVGYLEGRAGARGETAIRQRVEYWVRLCERARQVRRSPTTDSGRSIVGDGVARSAYAEQLRQLVVPPRLLDRDTELAELASFCAADVGSAYVWWQAGPWAGKTALLSTFVTNPPPTLSRQVWLVAFFITARLAGQDSRQAFIDVVTRQLCQLLGQNRPTDLSGAARDAALLDLLAQAAARCQAQGGRLVLIVDGLDEDRSVTTGYDARSIAGLLPGTPPAGMRIIVAGRANPPVPDDVPDWHPLRDPNIVRPLPGSPHARDVQRLSTSELKRLLRGDQVEQDLLGLLTAARGGLSGIDLRELTGAGLATIEDVLHTVAGRTFTRRDAQGVSRTGPPVYLLAHEELHAGAVRYLGDSHLARYRDQLHAWADTYRTRRGTRPSWPTTTPEYLMLGYPRVLNDTADVNRLVRLAVDHARHDWMRQLSGGDTIATAEILAAQKLVMDQPDADLYALVQLCLRRNALADRNTNIPRALPMVWARIGDHARAEALALSITDPDQQAQALTAMIWVALADGAAGQARQLTTAAESIAQSISEPEQQSQTLIEVARIARALGDTTQVQRLTTAAESTARSLADLYQRVQALTDVARGAAVAGNVDRAEAIARSLPHPYQQAQALTEVAQAAAAAGDANRARGLAAAAETIARSITDPYTQARALTGVIGPRQPSATPAKSDGWPPPPRRSPVPSPTSTGGRGR